jgi:TorA maturation chaperone TorD
MENVKLIEAFRDFFYYGQRAQMRQAYATIIECRGGNEKSEKINWDLEEFTFNRLFVGPMPPLAPAIASVYLDPEGLIQGPVTAEIRNFYQSIGLSIEEVGREPEDSLAYEFDACRHLLLLGREVPEALEVYTNFICKHVSEWVPEFYSRAIEHCTESTAVRDVLVSLLEWVTKETGKTMQHKEME